MTWIASAALALQFLLLVYVAVIDIATRLIHNEICLILALVGIASQIANPTHIAESLVVATILFLLLIVVYERGWIGGGDVKLLAALAIGLPLTGVVQLLTVTALAGAVLAAAHLMMRFLPHPSQRPPGRHSCAASTRSSAGAICGARRCLMGPRSRAAEFDSSQSRVLTMSSSLRLSIIMVLLLATAALGLVAYNMNLPKPVVQVTQNAPAAPTSGYFVAAHPLPAGTLARDEDFEVRSAPAASVPSGAIFDTPEARIGLRGSLVRKFLDTGSPVTAQDVLRPRDRGFLASVLAPDSRAISINVDAESGVSGLIWPGDYVDVVLTQVGDKADLAHRALSETVLHNVRIIAIDQEIVQGAPANNATAGKVTHSVSLQLAPEQVKKIAVAKELGKLSLAIRAAVEQQYTADAGTMFGCDVSPEIARQIAIARESTTVVVYAGEKVKEFSVKKHDTGDIGALFGCDRSPEVALQSAAVVSLSGDKGKE